MRVLLDTNVILDSIRKRKPFNIESDQILIDSAMSKFDSFMSASTVLNLHYIIHNELHNENQTRELIKNIIRSVKVIDTSAIDCVDALESDIKDYEDGVIEQTAYNNRIDVIVTRNKKDFKKSRIPAITPKEFIETFYVNGIYR